MNLINEGKGLSVSLIAKSRRQFLTRHIPASHTNNIRILEIGALDNPTFLKDEGDVYYADYFSQDESRSRHSKGSRTASRIVPVDFVLRNSTLTESISICPDLVIANHVIEHLPNPICWFRDISSIADKGSYLFLSIPDMRFTFDYFKPITDAVDWLSFYEQCSNKPTFYQILRHLIYHAKVDAADIWAGKLPNDHLHRINFSEATDKAKELSLNYTDVHCSFFTPNKFEEIINHLFEAKYISWKILAIEDVEFNSNEFRVLLVST
jgi:hypothetical protein